MAEAVYVSKVRIVRDRGPLRRAWLPARGEPVTFGVHSEIAQHYGVAAEDFPPDATTIDYLVAAAGG
jgi:hypothetical protein